VTHSMQQAVNLGDRIIMMHRGEIVADLQGPERSRARPEDLLARFDGIRRRERLNTSAAEILRQQYI
jgi:putative ABC transport system ATP-binding protein